MTVSSSRHLCLDNIDLAKSTQALNPLRLLLQPPLSPQPLAAPRQTSPKDRDTLPTTFLKRRVHVDQLGLKTANRPRSGIGAEAWARLHGCDLCASGVFPHLRGRIDLRTALAVQERVQEPGLARLS